MRKFHIVNCSFALALGLSAELPDPQMAASVTIDYTNTYQKIEGFGTSSIGWDSTMDAYYATDNFLNAYLIDCGMSMFRMPIWPEVLPKLVADAEKISYKNFDFSKSRSRSYVTIVRHLLSRKPDLRLIMTPWSPPAWMKTNGTITNGGSLRREYFQHYANYLVEWCKFWRAENIEVYAISLQNELLFVEPYESCVWTPEDYRDVLKLLGPKLEASGFGQVLIFGPEHMTGRVTESMSFVEAILQDPAAKPYLHRVAGHGYVDGVTTDTNPKAASDFYDKLWPLGFSHSYWMTETSGEAVSLDGALDGVAASLHNALVGADCSAYVYWQFSEPSPTVFSLRGNNQETHKYHAFRHYSKFIQPGMKRIDARTVGATKLDVSAFADAVNQKMVIVMNNRHTMPQPVSLVFRNQPGISQLAIYRTSSTAHFQPNGTLPLTAQETATLTLPARSISTLVGDAQHLQFPVFSVDAAVLTIDSGLGSLEIPVTSSLPYATWRVKTNVPSWITLPEETGVGSSRYTISWKRNTGTVARQGVVEIAGKSITIQQKANTGLNLKGNRLLIGPEGGGGNIEIEAVGSAGRTKAWTATSNVSWVIFSSPASGTGTGTVHFIVESNPTDQARIALLSISDSTFRIEQEAGPRFVSIFPAGGHSGVLSGFGFYFDGFYPFVWNWNEDSWLYVFPDGASLSNGFYFWHFAKNHWGWTAQPYLPGYLAFRADGNIPQLLAVDF